MPERTWSQFPSATAPNPHHTHRSRPRQPRPCPCGCGSAGFCSEHQAKLDRIRAEYQAEGKSRHRHAIKGAAQLRKRRSWKRDWDEGIEGEETA